MMLAARNGSLEAVEVLIAAGASMGVATPTGTTTLMQAVANGSLPVVAAILRAGAELDARDKTGATAVSISATMGFTDVARLLANAGASLDIADQQGSSPLLVVSVGSDLNGGAAAATSRRGEPRWPHARPLDSFMKFNVMPSTHVTYAATWASLTVAGGIITYLRFIK